LRMNVPIVFAIAAFDMRSPEVTLRFSDVERQSLVSAPRVVAKKILP